MEQKTVCGKFIVFEGIDGAGKTTQLDLLEKRMKKMGRNVVRQAEPTDAPIGKEIRRALSGEVESTPCLRAAMFVLDRIHHNTDPENGIRVTLEAGKDLLCDRYYYSSLAYQGSETNPAWVKEMNLNCPEIRKPDLCVFLDLTPEESMARINGRNAVHEIYETEERLRSVRNRFFGVFRDLEGRENIKVIRAAGSVEEVAERVWEAVQPLFAESVTKKA